VFAARFDLCVLRQAVERAHYRITAVVVNDCEGRTGGWSTETPIAVAFDKPKVATSDVPFGTVSGVQFVAVFQSLLAGALSHCALPAKATEPKAKRNNTTGTNRLIRLLEI
jgi:hypothetical protein